ncbi:MAG: hypothetical protein U0V70_16890 [Terriglobia bacterium]
MLVTPIASHTLTFRVVVVPDTAVIDMSLKSTQESVFLTVDGQVDCYQRGGFMSAFGNLQARPSWIESNNNSFSGYFAEQTQVG